MKINILDDIINNLLNKQVFGFSFDLLIFNINLN